MYNQFHHSYIQPFFPHDYFTSENTKRKRDEYESYKFIDDEEQISSDSEEDEELQLMQGYQPDRKRTKSSTPRSTISSNLPTSLSLSEQEEEQQQHFNNIHHNNNESGSIVENNQDDCMMMDDDDYSQHQNEEEPSLFVPPNLQNDPYSIQQFEYKRRQVYNHYRKEQERKMEEMELKQSMEQGETNFRLNPILRYLHNERKNRINSPFE